MSEVTPDGLTVIRPTPAARLKLWLPGVIAFPLFLLLGLVQLFTAPWLSIFLVVLAVVLLVVSIAQARILRLELGGGRYRFRSLLRRRDFSASEVRGVHTFTSLQQSIYTFADVTQQPVTTAQVRAAHPRLETWFEAHQIAAALLIGAGALVLMIVVIIAVAVGLELAPS